MSLARIKFSHFLHGFSLMSVSVSHAGNIPDPVFSLLLGPLLPSSLPLLLRLRKASLPPLSCRYGPSPTLLGFSAQATPQPWTEPSTPFSELTSGSLMLLEKVRVMCRAIGSPTLHIGHFQTSPSLSVGALLPPPPPPSLVPQRTLVLPSSLVSCTPPCVASEALPFEGPFLLPLLFVDRFFADSCLAVPSHKEGDPIVL